MKNETASSGGYQCAMCEEFVVAGEAHYCAQPYTITFNSSLDSDRVARILERIALALEKMAEK